MDIGPIDLIVAGFDSDAESSLVELLEGGGIRLGRHHSVHSEDELGSALGIGDCDILIASDTSDEIDCGIILALVAEVQPELPIIFVSKTVDPEKASYLLDNGASQHIDLRDIYQLPFAVIREINTARKCHRVIDVLQLTEARFKNLLENIPGIVYRCEIKSPWRMLLMNHYTRMLTGYPLEKFVKEPRIDWADIVCPEDIEELDRLIMHAVEYRTQFEAEYRIVNAKGEVVWVHEIGQPGLNAAGEPVWLDGVIMDVTDRKLAQQATFESQQQYRTLFESANDAIMIHDANMMFLDANTLACDRLGYTKEQLLQLTVYDIVSPEFAGRTMQQYELTQTLGRTVYETEHVSVDGNILPVEISCTRITYNGREAVIGIARDITDRKSTENALRDSEERYRAVYNYMNEGLCSHELVYDENGKAVDYRITDVNPMYESLVHILREDAVGRLATEVYGVSRPPFLDVYTAVAETGEPVAFDTYYTQMNKYFRISVFSPGKGRFVTLFADISNVRKMV